MNTLKCTKNLNESRRKKKKRQKASQINEIKIYDKYKKEKN